MGQGKDMGTTHTNSNDGKRSLFYLSRDASRLLLKPTFPVVDSFGRTPVIVLASWRGGGTFRHIFKHPRGVYFGTGISRQGSCCWMQVAGFSFQKHDISLLSHFFSFKATSRYFDLHKNHDKLIHFFVCFR